MVSIIEDSIGQADVEQSLSALDEADRKIVWQKVLFGLLAAVPDVRVTMSVMVSLGVWVSIDRIDWLLICAWVVITCALGLYRNHLVYKFRRTAPEQRDGEGQYWMTVARVIPIFMPVAYFILLMITFPVIQTEEKVALGLYGSTLGIGAVGFFAVAGPGMLLITLLGQVLAWYLYGGELAVAGAVVTLSLLIYFTPMHRSSVKATFNRAALEVGTQRLHEELRLRNAQLEDQSRDRNMLLVTASHDLRQPVQALEILTESRAFLGNISSLRQEVLAKMNTQVILLGDMLRSLLDISQLDMGIYSIQSTEFELNELIEEIGELYCILANSKGLPLEFRLQCTKGVIVRTDRGLLGRMLSNLVSNAVKYTQNGYVEIVTELCSEAEVRIHVIDTGVGINPDNNVDIFQSFVRAGTIETSTTIPGLGIGLAIVQRGAIFLGQKLDFESKPNCGSRFSLTLPVFLFSSNNNDKYETSALVSEFKTHNGRKIQVLLIDDDDSIRTAVQEFLTLWGFTIITSADLDGALYALSTGKFKPDILICDYQLSQKFNGTDCIEVIRQRMGSKDLPAILLTGDIKAELKDVEYAKPSSVLFKPLQPKQLLDTLRSLISRR